MTEDQKYMKRALRLARKGAGWVNPNPMVGAVVVKDGKIIGEGYHSGFGAPHAEVDAIRNACNPVCGTTLYVTLEPCNHHGKTPPCTEVILREKIARVVYGIRDPNPDVTGGGADFLIREGLTVEGGVMEREISVLNEVFLKFIRTRKPFVVLKSAMTLDGKIATVTNASRWITGSESRRRVHLLRHEYSAVMVGVDTVIFDDPLLNIRLRGGKYKNPWKIIVDTHARIPLNARVLLNDPQFAIIAAGTGAPAEKVRDIRRMGAQVFTCPEKDGRIDLSWLMTALGATDIDSVLIEGGSTLAFSAVRSGIVDKVITFIAPKLLGGAAAPTPLGGEGIPTMEEAVSLRDIRIGKTGKDVWVKGYLNYE